MPGRVRTSVLDVVMPDWPAAAEEPERRQLLELDGAHVRFRHELARHAIRSSVPAAACRRLHAEILEALLAAEADPADIVHHADAAGAEDVVADYALVAARRAVAFESNREAYSQYRRALGFVDRLPAAEQAEVFEEVAIAGYTVGRLEEAMPAIDAAIAILSRLGDIEAVGRCTRILSRLYWFAGDGVPAIDKAREAVAILEPLGESSELARAYSAVSQLAMLSEDGEQSLLWGERAIQLATKLGDDSTARTRARQHPERAGISSIPTTTLRSSRHTGSRTPPATGKKVRDRSRTSRSRSSTGAGPSRLCDTPSRGSRTRKSTTCRTSSRTRA